MTRRNWTIFAAMMIAALFLVGCGSDGDRGMAGPAGPPGDAPTAEEVAEALLADDMAVEMLTGPEGEAGEAGAPGDVEEVVSTLAMTPFQRIMTATGGTAPTGSKADVAKMQADIIANLKGYTGTGDWYGAGTIFRSNDAPVVKGAGLGKVPFRAQDLLADPPESTISGTTLANNVGYELSRTDEMPNPGADQVVNIANPDFDIEALAEAMLDETAFDAAMTAAEAAADAAADAAAAEIAEFNAYYDAIDGETWQDIQDAIAASLDAAAAAARIEAGVLAEGGEDTTGDGSIRDQPGVDVQHRR